MNAAVMRTGYIKAKEEAPSRSGTRAVARSRSILFPYVWSRYMMTSWSVAGEGKTPRLVSRT